MAWLLLSVLAPNVPGRAALTTMRGGEGGESDRHALLVGIEAYARQRGWPALRGPRADVEAMRSTLVDLMEFPAEQVRILLDEEATRAGIVSAFEAMIERAAPDDLVVFYFSGHGSQLPDEQADELDGFDETLIPFDSRDASGAPNDLRDDELRRLIRLANEKTSRVTLVFDCCSSGTVVRAGGARDGERFVPASVRGLAGTRPSVTKSAAVSAVAQTKDVGSGYFDEDLRYVALSACRASETALELELDEPGQAPRYHGLFTYALVQELALAADGPSYAELMERVRRRVTAQRPTQTPVIEGPLDKAGVFGRERVVRPPSFALYPERNPPRVAAGRLHGLLPGAELAVYPEGAVGEDEHFVGRIRIGQIRVDQCSFEWVTGASEEGGPLLRGVVVSPGVSEARFGVAVTSGVPEEAASEAAGEAVQRALSELSVSVAAAEELELVPADEAVVRVTVSQTDAGELMLDATLRGDRLSRTAAAQDPDGLAAFVEMLERLASAYLAQRTVFNEGGVSAFDFKTALEHEAPDGSWVDAVPRDDSGAVCLGQGDRVRWSFENRSEVPLYASLVVFSPDGEVAVVHRPENEDDAVPPGKRIRTRAMSPAWSEQSRDLYEHSSELFRWVVTRQYHDLRSLNRPSALTTRRLRGVALRQDKEVGEELRSDAWRTHTVSIRFRVEDR